MLDGIETSPEEYQAILRFVSEKPAKLVEKTVENFVDNKKPKKKVSKKIFFAKSQFFKNKIKRIASIQEASPKRVPKQESEPTKEEVTGNFQEKVQQLYKEAGNSWLVILNEITQEGEKQIQIEKEKKRIARQSMKYPQQPVIEEEEEEEEEEEVKEEVVAVVKKVEEVKEEVKVVNPPGSPNLQVVDR